MANVNPTVPATFDPVYQLEITDPNEAGLGGILNEQALALVNRTQYLLDLVTALQKKSPRYRGYITGIEIGSGTPGAAVSRSGDLTAASIVSVESGAGGAGSSTTMIVTFPTMGNTNYFVRISAEGRSDLENENDSLCPVSRIVSATQAQISIQQAFGTSQSMRLHLEMISYDL